MLSLLTKFRRIRFNTFLRTMNNCAVENPLKRISESVSDVEEKKSRNDFQRIKRRKYAALICYSGTGYLGLQRNPGRKTIEEDLLSAMLKAGAITEEAYNQPKVIEFQRAARTDKGVSAVRQILSLKLPMEISLEDINSNLPEQIRMVAVKRATKGFNCKGHCDARTYSYMMPSFALAPNEYLPEESYRITDDVFEKTNELLQTFVGTHNYHNFTSRKKPLDPSAQRYIISFICERPVLTEGMEFVVLKVKGQSFMLHQIRKMVGLIIAIMRGVTSKETVTKAWGEEKLDLPVAPGAGLVLEEVHYDRYNERYSKDGFHDAIEWSAVKEQLEEFKTKFILSSIVQTEKDEKSMLLWLENLPLHSFDVRNGNRNLVEDEEEEDDCAEEDGNDSSKLNVENKNSVKSKDE